MLLFVPQTAQGKSNQLHVHIIHTQNIVLHIDYTCGMSSVNEPDYCDIAAFVPLILIHPE